jgi:uncharacterized protein (DUF2235 family)
LYHEQFRQINLQRVRGRLSSIAIAVAAFRDLRRPGVMAARRQVRTLAVDHRADIHRQVENAMRFNPQVATLSRPMPIERWRSAGARTETTQSMLTLARWVRLGSGLVVTHVVCLDGTNQVKKQRFPTNIARIFDAVGGAAAPEQNGSWETTSGTPPSMTAKYLAGVGTQGNPVLKFLGNAFGDGIAEPIVRGYTYLSRNCAEGDEIVITGFSRGATAARALAGLIVSEGLLRTKAYDTADKSTSYLRGVAAWYAYRQARPDLADQTRLELISGTLRLTVPKLVAADYTPPPTIRAVAVFDTVSSLGLPHLGSHGRPLFDFSICDTALSPQIKRGFHALAADESRDLFSPTFWATRDGVVQQVFPGCHSDVGGGFENRGLSDFALRWMLDQLQGEGLTFETSRLDPPLDPDLLAPAQDDGAKFPFNLTPRSARAFPESAQPSQALLARTNNLAEMIPSLRLAPYISRGARADGTSLV